MPVFGSEVYLAFLGEVVPGAGVSGETVEQDLAIIEVAMK